MATKSHNIVNIQNLEVYAGLTTEAYEKKYLFHRLKGRFLHSSDLSLETSTPEGHENIYLPMDIQSPTQLDGLSYEDECALRIHGAQLCFQVCNQLKLPLTTALTSLVIFHRFFSKNSFVDYDYREISMAALYLGGKVEETMRKTWDIAGAFASVFNRQTQNPVDIIIKQERVILRELGFELFRISDHPHKFIESFYHFFKVDKQVAQKAWYYLNDSYLTNLCVHFPSQVIAAGALYLSLRVCNHPMPTQPWWILLESTFTQVEQVAATILSIYEFEKMDFRQAKRILSKANRVAYVIKHSEIYGAFEKVDNSDLKKTLPQQQPQQEIPKIEIQKSEKKSIKKKSKSKEKKSKNKKNKSEKKKNKSKDNKKEKKQKKRKSRSRSKSEEKKNQKKHNKDQKKDKDKNKETVKQTEKEKQNQNEQDLEQLQDKQLKVSQQIEIEQQQETLKQKMDLEIDQTNCENQHEKQLSNEKSSPSGGMKSANQEVSQNGQVIIQKSQENSNQNEENLTHSQKQPIQNKLDFISRIRAQLTLQKKEKEQEKEREKEKEKEIETQAQKDPTDSEEKDSEEDLQLQEIKQRRMAAKKGNE